MIHHQAPTTFYNFQRPQALVIFLFDADKMVVLFNNRQLKKGLKYLLFLLFQMYILVLLQLTFWKILTVPITFIKVTIWFWFHFQCILCWLIVFQQYYFTQLPFISNQETSVEFNSNWISKCICSSSMAWIELPNLNSFSHVLKFR